MFSRFLAFLLVLFLIPLFILISLIIFTEDGLPFLFTQKRIGINHTFFKIYKFRSMKKNTPDIATHLMINPNQYVLKTGRFLRKFSIDELPNLINIIKGEMLFIGPRPALYNQKDLIALRKTKGLCSYKPGITGWAQINGRDSISIEKKVELDLEYFKRKSFLFDLKIIILTFFNVFFYYNLRH